MRALRRERARGCSVTSFTALLTQSMHAGALLESITYPSDAAISRPQFAHCRFATARESTTPARTQAHVSFNSSARSSAAREWRELYKPYAPLFGLDPANKGAQPVDFKLAGDLRVRGTASARLWIKND